MHSSYCQCRNHWISHVDDQSSHCGHVVRVQIVQTLYWYEKCHWISFSWKSVHSSVSDDSLVQVIFFHYCCIHIWMFSSVEFRCYVTWVWMANFFYVMARMLHFCISSPSLAVAGKPGKVTLCASISSKLFLIGWIRTLWGPCQPSVTLRIWPKIELV